MLTAIVTTHNNPTGLARILENLHNQTVIPKEIIVLGSCTDFSQVPETILCVRDQNINDWGHNKRRLGILLASGEYIGFFNDDDSYTYDYIEKMLAASVGNDAVYCGWSTYSKPTFTLGSSTSGNFIVKTTLAKEIGYPWRVYESDGLFIQEINKRTNKIAFVDEVLYYHNR